MDREVLRSLIEHSLMEQGFRVQGGKVLPPADLDKEKLRKLHALAVKHRVARSRVGLYRHEARLLDRLACGASLVPERITPRLVIVEPDSDDELLFRYATLHWTIPVSSGYGRRLRFLVVDDQNDKLMGVIGLGDPVFSLGGRDRWIGWGKEAKRQRLHNVMDAFALGAVPPYSFLLGGKLVAMLVASVEVRNAFARKYQAGRSIILNRPLDGALVLVTTASALGRSSIYNRLSYRSRLLFERVGFTQGSGEFHFANGLYRQIFEYATKNCTPTAKHQKWGTGFRARREVVRRCLSSVGLSEEWVYHGVRRELFTVPLAQNAREFLRGENERPDWYVQSVHDLWLWFRERWLLPRASRDSRYKEFLPASYRLWSGPTGLDI